MATDRLSYWIDFVRQNNVKVMAEIGVWRGDFAHAILSACPSIERYFLVDPWQVLDDWNKPLNRDDLEDAFNETQQKLAPFAGKTVFLRGRTIEVASELPTLDFAYIDGDHTLRGITLDLNLIWPKIRSDGWLGGDDFSPTIWQHSSAFEPSMVYPYAVYFAEAVNAPIRVPNENQFLIEKRSGFAFDDPQNAYPHREIGKLIKQKPPISQRIRWAIDLLRKMVRKS